MQIKISELIKLLEDIKNRDLNLLCWISVEGMYCKIEILSSTPLPKIIIEEINLETL